MYVRLLYKSMFCRIVSALAIIISSAGCVQKSDTYLRNVAANPTTSQPSTKSQSQTINLEEADRIARFRRLADVMGIAPPQIDELYAPAGSVPGVDIPVPVVRVVFDERVFFDFDSTAHRPESGRIIEIVASNMKRDVPDAALTILGHTDAVGSDTYNIELSQRRASTVLSELIERGLNPNQLSTIAIGKAQPIAPNITEEGRARNRRVEFLISGSEQANFAVIQDRSVNAAYLAVTRNEPLPRPMRKTAQVLKPTRRPVSPNDEGILGPAGMLTLREAEPAPMPVIPTAVERPAPRAPEPRVLPRASKPAPTVVPREPEPVLPAPLQDPSPLNF